MSFAPFRPFDPLRAVVGQGLASGGYESEIDAWIAALILQGDSVSSNNAAAWDTLVKGAKTAGYWSAIKCLVPIAGPSLGGNRAPVHIVGISPTVVGTFASGERSTTLGFTANGTAYLNTGVAGDSTTYFGGQNDWYYGFHLTQAMANPWTTSQYIGGGVIGATGKAVAATSATIFTFHGGAGSIALTVANTATFTGVLSARRNASGVANALLVRAGATTAANSSTSSAPASNIIRTHAREGSSPLLSPGAVGAYFMGTASVDESHFRGLLDTCFASLT